MSMVFRTAVFHPLVAFRVLIAAFLLGFVALAPASADETQAAAATQAVFVVEVDGLACPFCAYGIEKELSRLDGVESVETDIQSGTVIVTMKPGATLDEADAKRAVKAAGFTMRGFRKEDGEA